MVFWKKFLYFLVFLVKNAKTTFLKENVCFFSKMFSQIKMQAATNWSSHLKNIKHLIFFSNDRFFMQFSKITFSEIFENN